MIHRTGKRATHTASQFSATNGGEENGKRRSVSGESVAEVSVDLSANELVPTHHNNMCSRMVRILS
jgi:hypothetical protein